MVFDPTSFKAPQAKKLPVILLLDVSGSMAGEKINTLYDAVSDMLRTFSEAKTRETVIDVAIITFGEEVLLHTPYTPVDALRNSGLNRFYADGMTPLGTALKMAKTMIEDKTVTPSRIYRPAIVLVSDGMPNDNWERPLEDFIKTGRSSKCQCFSVAIGIDGMNQKSMLLKFCASEDRFFHAENVSQIIDAFAKISMSISVRAASQNPNQVAGPSYATYDTNPNQDEDDEDIYI